MNNIINLPTLNNLSAQKTSAKYGVVSTKDLVGRLQEAMPNALDYDKATVGVAGGTRHHVGIPMKGVGPITFDNVIPTLNILNSYQGESSLQLLIGFYRIACSNGMIIGKGVYQKKIRHIQGDKLSLFLDSFESEVAEAINDTQETLHIVSATQDMRVSSLTVLEVLRRLYDMKIITKKAAEQVAQIYINRSFRRVEDKFIAWSVYGLWNIINEELRLTATNKTTYGSLLNKNLRLLDEIVHHSQEVA